MATDSSGRLLLIERGTLLKHAEDARRLFKRAADAIVRHALGSSTLVRNTTGRTWWPSPFYFEIHGLARGEVSADGAYQEHLDAHGRVLLSKTTNRLGRTEYIAYEHTSDGVHCFFGSEFKGAHRLSRVGNTGKHGEVEYFITAAQREQAHACAWLPRDRPSTIQNWDLRLEQPDSVEATYGADGALLALTRNGTVIWRAQLTPAAGPPIAELATRIIELVRRRLKDVSEPILVLSVCFGHGDPKSLPPQIGVVFERDAEAFLLDRAAFGDDVNALFNPTLQESYPFPTSTHYPFVELSEQQGIETPWNASDMLQNLLALVDALNAARQGEPAFLLVDMNNDATAYVDRLPLEEQRRLSRYL